MDAELTLKLDKDVIERAKEYASSQERSLSNLVENLLKAVTIDSQKNKTRKEIEITPFVKSIGTPSNIPADWDYKEERHKYIMEKHK